MPKETHTHHYEAGKLVRTEVTRESPWDDHSRAEVAALALYEASLCPGCGNPVDETHDDKYVAIVEQHVCMACRAKDIVVRDAGEKHKDDKPGFGLPGFHDGRRYSAHRYDTD